MQDPLVGKVLADRFEILERIGEGGTGVVYRAKQLSVDRTVAIKILGAHVSTDPSWVKRFHNEARAASRLDHPNTVRLIDFGQTQEGLLFIAMEFLHGRSLRQELDRVGRLPPNRVLRIVSQVCASLQEAHSQGIIHRDIKPDNIYLVDMKGSGDFVKVLDFSVAKLDTPDAQVTRAGVVFGTPAYMSPEQGRGVQLDARSDVYAVGIVAYEMLNGKPPFDAKIPTEVVMMHLREQPAPLTSAPPQLAAIVMKALQKDPAKRQQTAHALDEECQACFAELFPRQTPGTGVQGIVAPAPQQLGHGATMEQKTMMAGMQAPNIPGGIGGINIPGGVGGPMGGPTAPVGGAPAGHQDQRTMMAGMQAPNVPLGAPPPGAPAPGQDQKTMMAGMQAPNIPGGVGGINIPGGVGGVIGGSIGGAPGGQEQKTMMAGMQAPNVPLGAPPPSVGPPPSVMAPMGVQTAGQNEKTVLGMMAPNIPAPSQPAQPAQPSGQKTVALSSPVGNFNPAGTQILPDSAGVVAFAREQAEQARLAAAAAAAAEPPAPAGALFWIAWILIGVGSGIGVHFLGIGKGIGL